MTTIELAHINGKWHKELLPADICEYEGRLWQALPDDPTVIHLGIAPAPTTIWQALVYHVCHGLIMHYPLLDVLVWSWRNRRSFLADEIVEAGTRADVA